MLEGMKKWCLAEFIFGSDKYLRLSQAGAWPHLSFLVLLPLTMLFGHSNLGNQHQHPSRLGVQPFPRVVWFITAYDFVGLSYGIDISTLF